MILVLRRWFVPSERLGEFVSRWRNEIEPMIVRQPSVPIPKFACVRYCEARSAEAIQIRDPAAIAWPFDHKIVFRPQLTPRVARDE